VSETLFVSESEERVFGEPYFAGIIRGRCGCGKRAMGREMARLLVARIRGEPVEDSMVILGTHLVTRASSGAPH
jgi:hypothetical protein